MKYLIPEMVLILLGIFFTKIYIDISIYFFKFLYHVTSLAIFAKPFLAFPFVTLLIFILIGCVKKLLIKAAEYQKPMKLMNFIFKENFIFIIVLMAFLYRIFEAVGETEPISPYWVIQHGSFDLLLNMIGLFSVSSVILHLFFSVKIFLKN